MSLFYRRKGILRSAVPATLLALGIYAGSVEPSEKEYKIITGNPISFEGNCTYVGDGRGSVAVVLKTLNKRVLAYGRPNLTGLCTASVALLKSVSPNDEIKLYGFEHPGNMFTIQAIEADGIKLDIKKP